MKFRNLVRSVERCSSTDKGSITAWGDGKVADAQLLFPLCGDAVMPPDPTA